MSSVIEFVKKHPYFTVAGTLLIAGGAYYYVDQQGLFFLSKSI